MKRNCFLSEDQERNEQCGKGKQIIIRGRESNLCIWVSILPNMSIKEKGYIKL